MIIPDSWREVKEKRPSAREKENRPAPLDKHSVVCYNGTITKNTLEGVLWTV